MVAKFFGSLFGSGAVPPRPAEQAPAPAAAVDPAAEELTATAAALEELRKTALVKGAELPTVVVSQMLQLVDVLRALIRYIGRSGASTEQRVLLNAVITDYLPSPLRAYLMLASSSRTDESSETTVLLEQLGTLYSTVLNLDNQVRTGAITELAVHGQFLKDKFDIDGLHLEGR
jgi:signal transduction histidine kinase